MVPVCVEKSSRIFHFVEGRGDPFQNFTDFIPLGAFSSVDLIPRVVDLKFSFCFQRCCHFSFFWKIELRVLWIETSEERESNLCKSKLKGKENENV